METVEKHCVLEHDIISQRGTVKNEVGGTFLFSTNQSTLRPTKCMTVECRRMLSITTLQTTIMTNLTICIKMFDKVKF